MEDLTYIRERLDYGKYMNRRLHSWAFARLQGRIEDKATEAGIPVEYVNPAYTSQTCHSCHTYRSAGLPSRVPVSERRLPRFDVSGRHQRFREYRTTG